MDAGLIENRVRVLTAGGISSGLDATLHLVELVKDREAREFVATLMEYEPTSSTL